MEPLVSTEELRTYIQRPVNEEAATLAVAGASGMVRAHCGWNISLEVDAYFNLSGTNTRVLSLPTLHLLTVQTVNIDTLPVVDYQMARRGQLYRASAWPDFRRIEVVATHGYAEIPDVIRVVTLAYAARQVGNPERFKIAAVGSVSRTFDTDLTDLDTALLHPYRIFTTT